MIHRKRLVAVTARLALRSTNAHVAHMTNRPTPPFTLPLSDADREIVISRLQALPSVIKGDDIVRLIQYVELAQQPVADRYKPLGRGAAAAAASELDADVLAAELPALIKAAKRYIALPAWPRAIAAAEASQRPERLMVDPFARALVRFATYVGGTVRMHRTRHLRRAIELIASLPEAPSPLPAGAPYDRGGASGLVRAVSVYAHENGFFQRDWPGPGSARDTPTLTAELIVQTARAFGITANNSALRTNLRNYVTELNALEREEPDELDLYGRLFGNSPSRRSRAP